MVARLGQMLAPMLVFTAEEAWEFIPGKPIASVHCSDWSSPVAALGLSAEDEAAWKEMFHRRETILGKLEEERRAKRIGKSLEAVVELCGDVAADPGLAVIARYRTEFQELLNVSAVSVVSGPAGQAETTVTVQPASGLGRFKCDRCWHWETEVGSHAVHTGLCPRCIVAVESVGVS